MGKVVLGFIVAICLFLFIGFVGIALVSSDKTPTNTFATSTSENRVSEIKPVQVSALKLAYDYQANEVSADNLYRNKSLLVQGMVTQIRKDFMDGIIVSLATMNEFETVDAHVNPSESAKAANLQRFQSVRLLCVGSGMVIGSPQLKNCTFEENRISEPPSIIAKPQSSEPVTEQQIPPSTTTTTAPSKLEAQPADEQSPAPIERHDPTHPEPKDN